MTDNTETETETDTDTKRRRQPANERVAATLRSKASRFGSVEAMLDKWASLDADGAHIPAIRELIETASTALLDAAEMVENLPDEVLRTKRGRRKKADKFEPGVLARVREKHVETYLELTDGEPVDALTVVDKRGSHVLVETPGGLRMFVNHKDLEVVDATNDEAEDPAA